VLADMKGWPFKQHNRGRDSNPIMRIYRIFAFTIIPENSVVILLLRSGQSIEVVNEVAKCRAASGIITSITNNAEWA